MRGVQEMQRRFCINQLASGDKGVQRFILDRSAEEPLWWVSTFCWSHNPRKPPKHQQVPHVLWDFQDELVGYFLGLKGYRRADHSLWPLVVDKSRDMGVTWTIVDAQCWGLLFSQVDYGMMTKAGSDLDGQTHQSLFGKVDYVLERLPAWMIDRHPAALKRKHSNPSSILYGPTGSTITGSLTVPDAFRQQRHTRTTVDEAPCVPKLDSVLASLKDVTSQPCLVGTPKGKEAFYRLVKGEDVMTLEAPCGLIGWLHRSYHYSRHPERNPDTPQGQAWYERERAERTAQAWDQEQEISYETTAPGRIWPEFNRVRHVYTDPTDALWLRGLQFLDAGRWVNGWDFGSGANPTCVLRSSYVESIDTLYLYCYRSWTRRPADLVGPEYFEHVGRPGEEHVGDIAGNAKNSSQTSWMIDLAEHDIYIDGITLAGRGAWLRDLIHHKIEQDKIIIGPLAAQIDCGDSSPSMVDVMQQYSEDPKTRKPIKKGDRGKYSHLADCLQYIAWRIWGNAAYIRNVK